MHFFPSSAEVNMIYSNCKSPTQPCLHPPQTPHVSNKSGLGPLTTNISCFSYSPTALRQALEADQGLLCLRDKAPAKKQFGYQPQVPTPELSPHYQSTPRQPPGNNVSIPTRGSGQGARSSCLEPDLYLFFPLSPRTVSIPHSPRSPWRLQPQISHCQLSFHRPQVTHIPASYTVRGGTATWDLWTAMLQRTGRRKTTLTQDAQGAHPSLCSRYRSSPGPSPMPSASV